jgi:hypothetical protein
MATFGTFTAGQILTAAELNSAGAWQDYTPTWTQSATITKTVNWARFMQLNKLVQVSIKMTASSNGTSAEPVLIGLPVNASSNNLIMGTAHFSTSEQITARFCLYNDASTIRFSTGLSQSINLSTSFTTQVVSGNVVHLQFAYEAA